ncbi:unnamed protein product [Lampetra planeri]
MDADRGVVSLWPGPQGHTGVAAAVVLTPAAAAVGESRPGDGSAHLRLRRLSPVGPFVAKGGNWLFFQARFDAAYQLVRWPEKEEALCALPTCLDARALQAFLSILPADKSTLQSAYHQMAEVFEPPSAACLKFTARRREEGESPLAFCCSLLALARAAYPVVEGGALDSLALERLLVLAGELGIALSIAAECKITSLAVVQNIQATLALRRPPAMVACAGAPTPAEVAAPREEDYDRRGDGPPPDVPGPLGGVVAGVLPTGRADA